MDALVTPWANARVAHLLSVHRMMPMEVGDGKEEKLDMNDDNQLMYTQNAETIELFSSHIVPSEDREGICRTQDGSLP